ncbi:hypothetical protein N7539_002868 [Penicillium diatomitis]|uniref:C6 transcription factor n=1 Tax=Penicillium diatomitis TaxID=2819901 RepID=A0A9W9XFJ7_9EURO|nr:uncharacterized protein N7539_002868 [Penicillium diatomitis]KAJ5491301.1 hypothetical protein N7539_002868 [Penicillium diatomitis]
MLESHHALVVKALQKLYKFCINKEGFPGEPLAEAPDGHPLTHTILDRLGLIKQAEENADEVDEDSEDLRYLRILSTSTECSVTAEPSPEPTTPTEPSPTTSSRASVCQGILTPMTSRNNSTWQWDMQATQQTNLSYPGNGFPGFFAPARPSIGSADSSSGDVFSHIDNSSPSILSHHPPRHDQQLLTYFLDPASNIASSSSIESKSVDRYNQGFHISETHSHAAATLPGDVWTDFNFPTHDQALYETFTPSWSFPSA